MGVEDVEVLRVSVVFNDVMNLGNKMNHVRTALKRGVSQFRIPYRNKESILRHVLSFPSYETTI